MTNRGLPKLSFSEDVLEQPMNPNDEIYQAVVPFAEQAMVMEKSLDHARKQLNQAIRDQIDAHTICSVAGAYLMAVRNLQTAQFALTEALRKAEREEASSMNGERS